jgi:hypothetical protein
MTAWEICFWRISKPHLTPFEFSCSTWDSHSGWSWNITEWLLIIAKDFYVKVLILAPWAPCLGAEPWGLGLDWYGEGTCSKCLPLSVGCMQKLLWHLCDSHLHTCNPHLLQFWVKYVEGTLLCLIVKCVEPKLFLLWWLCWCFALV